MLASAGIVAPLRVAPLLPRPGGRGGDHVGRAGGGLPDRLHRPDHRAGRAAAGRLHAGRAARSAGPPTSRLPPPTSARWRSRSSTHGFRANDVVLIAFVPPGRVVRRTQPARAQRPQRGAAREDAGASTPSARQTAARASVRAERAPDRPRAARRRRARRQRDGRPGRRRAPHRCARDPERAREALRADRGVPAAQALDEMRRLLGVLRAGEADGALAPQPGAATGSTTSSSARARRGPAGRARRRRRARARCRAGVDLAAYRIVQEALTNTLKHAGAAPGATSSSATRPTRVELEVADDGHGAGNGAAPARRPRPRRHARARRAVRRRARGRARARAAATRVACAAPRRAVGGAPHERARADRRRPGAGARRLPHDPRRRGRHRGGRRGRATGARRSTRRARCSPTSCSWTSACPSSTASRRTRRLIGRARGATIRVLILTTFDLDEYVYEALRAGASGFLLKDAPAEQLDRRHPGRRRRRGAARALDHAPADRGVRPRRRPGRAAAGPGRAHAARARRLQLVARGLSNAEIASELIVSETTVKTHVARMLMKLGLRDRVQAVVLAYEAGIVTPGAQA